MTTEGSLDPQQLPDEPQSRHALAAELKQKALAAQQRGELLTAMLHASDALMLYPNEREYLDLVDEIALATQDPLSLVPVATGAVHVATAAVRARIMMMQKDLGGAIELVCEVVDVAPDLDYFDWVRRWLQPQIIDSLGWKSWHRAWCAPASGCSARRPLALRQIIRVSRTSARRRMRSQSSASTSRTSRSSTSAKRRCAAGSVTRTRRWPWRTKACSASPTNGRH